MDDASNYCRERRTFLPPVYNEKRMKEYVSDVGKLHHSNPLALNGFVDAEQEQIDELRNQVNRLNEKVGSEDLTRDENDENEEDDEDSEDGDTFAAPDQTLDSISGHIRNECKYQENSGYQFKFISLYDLTLISIGDRR